jgi:hypothetical protein
MDQVIAKVDSILVVFELEGVSLAEEMPAHMEASQDRLKAFIKKNTGGCSRNKD